MSLNDCPLELVTSIFELACLITINEDRSKTARALRLSSKRYFTLATSLEFRTLVLSGQRQVQRACGRILDSEPKPEYVQTGVKAEESGPNTSTSTNTDSVTNGKQDASTSSEWPEAQIHHLFISDRPPSVLEPEPEHTVAPEQLEPASSNTSTGSIPIHDLETHRTKSRAFWMDVNALLTIVAPTLRTLALVVPDDRDETLESDAVLDTLLGQRRSFPLLRSLVLKHGQRINNRNQSMGHGGPEIVARQERERDNGRGQRRGSSSRTSRNQGIDLDSGWHAPFAPLLESLTLAGCVYLTIAPPRRAFPGNWNGPVTCALHPILVGHTTRYPELRMLRLRGREVLTGGVVSMGPLAGAICGRQTDKGREVFSSEGEGEGEGKNLENVHGEANAEQSAEQIAEDHLANGRLPGRLQAVQIDVPKSQFIGKYPQYSSRLSREDHAFTDAVYACGVEGITVSLPWPAPEIEPQPELQLDSVEREYEILYNLWYTEMEKMWMDV